MLFFGGTCAVLLGHVGVEACGVVGSARGVGARRRWGVRGALEHVGVGACAVLLGHVGVGACGAVGACTVRWDVRCCWERARCCWERAWRWSVCGAVGSVRCCWGVRGAVGSARGAVGSARGVGACGAVGRAVRLGACVALERAVLLVHVGVGACGAVGACAVRWGVQCCWERELLTGNIIADRRLNFGDFFVGLRDCLSKTLLRCKIAVLNGAVGALQRSGRCGDRGDAAIGAMQRYFLTERKKSWGVREVGVAVTFGRAATLGLRQKEK